MSRRRYLVTYDISDDKRRTAVFKYLEGEGDHVQYSVFLCELTARERIILDHRLSDLIHHREDQVLLLDLGPNHRIPDSFLSALGKPYTPPTRTMVI
jgi:CRISPR-associated protein Cas2